MDTITERNDSLVGSFVIFNGWGLQFTIFCLALLFIFGTRVLFLFPRQHTWITYVIRVVGGAVPVTVFIFLIAVVYSRSGSISYVTFFQISKHCVCLFGACCGRCFSILRRKIFRTVRSRDSEQTNANCRLKNTLTDIRHIRKELPGTVPIPI